MTSMIKTGSGAPTASLPEGSQYNREDAAAGAIYVRHNGVWEELARNATGAIAVTSLAASGSEGQALISHSGVWTPSTDFSAQNLVTTGTLSVGSGGAKTVLRPVVGSPTFPGIYLGNITPDATNFAAWGDGATFTGINAPTSSGVISFNIGGGAATAIVDATSIKMHEIQAGLIRMEPRSADLATFDFTIRSQAPFASATTQAKRTPGNLVYDIAAPVGDGLDGFHKFQAATVPIFTIGFVTPNSPARSVSGIYPGAVTPSATNYAFGYSVGDTGSGGVSNGNDYIVLNSPGSVMTRTTVDGVGTTGSQVRVAVNNRGVARFMIDGLFFGTSAALPANGYIVGAINPIIDVAPVDLSVIAQAPFATAIINKNSAKLILGTAAPVSGGTAGSVFLKPNATTALEAAATGIITLPHYTTAGILHNDASGVVSSSLIVNADITNATITPTKWDISGLADGQTWVRTGGVLVATTVGTGSGTVTGVVAGNGLTGGGSSGSVTVDVAAADATITVTANAIAVGQIANANVAAGAAISYSKLNLTGSVVNADIVSLAWSKITGHPTDLGGYGITDAAASSINLIAGAGMTGGGTLTSNRTFNVIANVDGSIVVNADDIQVGIITDAQHGARAGGSLHPGATTSVAGFVTMVHDLAGTGGSPNVVAISGAGGTAAIRCANLLFDAAVTSASIGQTISSATTSPLTIFAQHTTSGTGAALNLSSGFGGSPGNNVGAINLQLGTVTKLSLLATPELQWDQAVNEPLYTQAAAASGNNGVTTTHRSQDGVGTNKSGGKWRAFGGAKTGTGLAGGAQIGLGGSIVMVETAEVASGKYVSVLNHLTSVSTSATGSDPGSLVTYVGDCASEPTTNPSSGVLLYSVGGTLKCLRSDGILVN